MEKILTQSLHSIYFEGSHHQDHHHHDNDTINNFHEIILKTFKKNIPPSQTVPISDEEILSHFPNTIPLTKEAKLYFIFGGRPLKLTESSEAIILCIAKSGHKGITQSELAKEMKLDPRSLFHLLKNILELNLITKSPITHKKTFTFLLKIAILSSPDDNLSTPIDADADEDDFSAADAADVFGNDLLPRTTDATKIKVLYLSKGIEQQVVEYITINHSSGCTLTDLMIPFSMNRKMIYRLIERIVSLTPNAPLIKKSELVGKAKQHRIYPSPTLNIAPILEQQQQQKLAPLPLRGSTVQQENRLYGLLEIIEKSLWVECSKSLIDLLQENLAEQGGHLMDAKTLKRLVERLEVQGEVGRIIIDSTRTILYSLRNGDELYQNSSYNTYLLGTTFNRRVFAKSFSVWGEMRKLMLLHEYIDEYCRSSSSSRVGVSSEALFSSIPQSLIDHILQEGREERGIIRLFSLLISNRIIRIDRRYPLMPSSIPYRFDYIFKEDIESFYSLQRKDNPTLFYFISPNDPEFRESLKNLCKDGFCGDSGSGSGDSGFSDDLKIKLDNFCYKYQLSLKEVEREISLLAPQEVPSVKTKTKRKRAILPRKSVVVEDDGFHSDDDDGTNSKTSSSSSSSSGEDDVLEERIGNSFHLSSKLDSSQVKIVHLLFELLIHPSNRRNATTLQWTLIEDLLPKLSTLLGTALPTCEELRIYCQRMSMVQWNSLLTPYNPIRHQVRLTLSSIDGGRTTPLPPFKEQFDLLMCKCSFGSFDSFDFNNTPQGSSSTSLNVERIFLDDGEWEERERLLMFRKLTTSKQWEAFCLNVEGNSALLCEDLYPDNNDFISPFPLQERREMTFMDSLLSGDNINHLLDDIVNGEKEYIVESNGKVYI